MFCGCGYPPPVPNTHLWTNVPQEIFHTHKFVTSSSLGKLKKAVSYILKSCPGILAVRVPSQAATESSSQAVGVPHKLLECLTSCWSASQAAEINTNSYPWSKYYPWSTL